MENYEKQKLLGKGSFGVVYLVREKKSNSLKVIKQVNIANLSGKLSQNARDEVGLLSQLDHPNIVKYYDSFFEGASYLYLVTEYCDGGDLFAKIKRQRGVYFSERSIQSWLFQLASAIMYIHQRHILHRDIKAANVFLSRDERTLKLGDFGVAKLLRHKYEMANTCIGTPYYLSPEICAKREYNCKSDIWALGCLSYELLTLKCPFSGKNLKELFACISRLQYLPMPARYSYELRNLVSQMLRKNPDERPSADKILAKPFLCRSTNVEKPKQSHPRKHFRKMAKPILKENLGSLSVYAVPLTRKRTNPTRRVSIDSTSSSIVSEATSSVTARRKWNKPSGTLISALSSFNLNDSTEINSSGTYELRKTVSFDSAFSEFKTLEQEDMKADQDEESVPFADTGEATCVLLESSLKSCSETVFQQLEAWRSELEKQFDLSLLPKVLESIRFMDSQNELMQCGLLNAAIQLTEELPALQSCALQIVQLYCADRVAFES